MRLAAEFQVVNCAEMILQLCTSQRCFHTPVNDTHEMVRIMMVSHVLLELVLSVERLGSSAALEYEATKTKVSDVYISFVAFKFVASRKCRLAPGIVAKQPLLCALCFLSPV
jgi:hypothetical protein